MAETPRLTPFPSTLTNDQIETEIADKAASEGDDWRLRLMRRRPTGELEHLCTFTGVRAEHFTHADEWLPPFAGGGEYRLTAFHHTAPNKSFSGSKVVHYGGAPKAPNFSIVRTPDWRGPVDVLTRLDRPAEEIPMLSADGGGMASPMARAVPPSAGSSPEKQMEYQLKRERDLLDRERALDMKAERDRNEMALKALEAKMESNRAPPPPAPDFGAPLREMMTLMMNMQDKADARMERLITAMSAKKEDSPVLEKLLDKALSGADVAQKSALAVQEAIVGSMRNNMQMMQMFNETLRRDAEPAEEGLGSIVRDVVRGFAEASAAQAETKREEMRARAQVAAARIAQQRRPPPAVATPTLNGIPTPPASAAPSPPDIAAPAAPTEAVADAPSDDEEMSALETLDDMIRSYEDPGDTVDYLIGNLQDPEIQAEFRKYKSRLLEWFTARHGAWAMTEGEKASDYAGQLAAVAKEKFSALQAQLNPPLVRVETSPGPTV